MEGLGVEDWNHLALRREYMKSRMSTKGIAVGLACMGACRANQPAQLVVLAQAEATLPGSFGQVSTVVELQDGRVALADLRDRTFLFASFAPPQADTTGTP